MIKSYNLKTKLTLLDTSPIFFLLYAKLMLYQESEEKSKFQIMNKSLFLHILSGSKKKLSGFFFNPGTKLLGKSSNYFSY